MNMLDIFKDNKAFTLKSLTESINILPIKPGKIGAMNLFASKGVNTTSVAIESREGVLALLPTRRRGEAASLGRASKGKVRSFVIPHIPFDDVILPGDIQDVRKFGSTDELAGAVSVVNDRMTEMKQSMDVTLEYHRMGAIHGVLLDSDGATTLYNLFTEFGVSETTVNFVLDDAATDIRGKCTAVRRAIEAALGGGVMYNHIHAFCGKNWFDAFVGHDYVADSWDNFNSGKNRRDDLGISGFEYGNIWFDEYVGSVSGVDFIDDDEVRFFPAGAPGLFITYFAPGDFMETANTIGLPYYAKTEPLPLNRGVQLHIQSNPLCMCNRPGCLIKGIINT